MELDDILDYGHEHTLGMHFLGDEVELTEDRLILLPSGERACINWELSGNGYSQLDLNSELNNENELSDKELLISALSEAQHYKKNKYYNFT